MSEEARLREDICRLAKSMFDRGLQVDLRKYFSSPFRRALVGNANRQLVWWA